MNENAPPALQRPPSASPAPVSDPTRPHARASGEAGDKHSDIVETDIPARLDALPFGGFHLLVIATLGITWILDGLEVTLAGSLSGQLMESSGLSLNSSQIGFAGSAYLIGAVGGAFVFGWLTDRLGRKKLFSITLLVYLAATAATAFSWDAWSFLLFRLLTGAGIGGEYAAINSAIQELIPARVRGRTDLIVNGSFWIGAALGAGGSLLLLNSDLISPALGWRLAFLTGAIIGLGVLIVRHWVPESPRWLITHGHVREADVIVSEIERRFAPGAPVASAARQRARLRVRDHTPLSEVARVLFQTQRQRTLVGLILMGAQAFFYNAIFFTYGLVLTKFYDTPANRIGWYLLPFAAGNVLGPILLGQLFDTIGRKTMIALTYGVSGVLLAVTAYLFSESLLSARELTIAWMVVFFFASAAASSAYLTVGESFPLEVRALAIAFFYAAGTAVGGAIGPLLLGILIDSGSRGHVAAGYLIGAALMLAAALAEALWGVAAERKPLEAVSRPLSFVDS